eukprot:GHVU01081853.1.p1 GENE.GHVU01081853.1~~GHVU01081853.1.p1  ORF type:complete len:166 (+),score=2.90 GHVU01081853.1:141-638(+)
MYYRDSIRPFLYSHDLVSTELVGTFTITPTAIYFGLPVRRPDKAFDLIATKELTAAMSFPIVTTKFENVGMEVGLGLALKQHCEGRGLNLDTSVCEFPCFLKGHTQSCEAAIAGEIDGKPHYLTNLLQDVAAWCSAETKGTSKTVVERVCKSVGLQPELPPLAAE